MIVKIELAGIGGYDAAPYCGTGCFHRRESLSGEKYSEEHYSGRSWNVEPIKNDKSRVDEMENASKVLASCGYEKDTQWGKEV